MTLKEKFELDDFDPRLEALDLLTSYSCTMKFLEYFQNAIFDKEKQMLSVKEVYIEYLYSLGLINTEDDLPGILTGRNYNPNECQAIRNIKFPKGLGSIAAYMCLNLGVAKEIAADKLPNKNSSKVKSEWFFDEFDIIEDEANANPSVSRIITRLRNSISHHNFKLRVPDSRINEKDLRDKVEISFFDTDGKVGNDFYAKASLRVIEKTINKIHSVVYSYHSCPSFNYNVLNTESIVEYVKECFVHFCRYHHDSGLKFKGIKILNPMEMYEFKTRDGYYEMSKSDIMTYRVCFSLNEKTYDDNYIDIPCFDRDNPVFIIIEDEVISLGEYPVEWLLNNARSPLCRLDKKIRDMINYIINDSV